MSDTVPSGLKSLLECLSRATLLAQPEDVLKFLSRHVEDMVNSRHEPYCHEEQWEKNFFLEKSKERTSTAQMPTHLHPVCPQNALRPPLYPREERPRTRRAFSDGFPIEQKSEGLKAEEIATLDVQIPVPPSPPPTPPLQPQPPPQPPPPPPPSRERVKSGPSPVRTPGQTKTKSTLSSARPPVPLTAQKAPTQGQSKLKRPCSRTITCRLPDCPHHKPKERSEVLKEAKPVAISRRPMRQVDMALQYRPKGGYITDPELTAKRTTKNKTFPYRQTIAVRKGNVVPVDTKGKHVNTCLTPGHSKMSVKQRNIPPKNPV